MKDNPLPEDSQVPGKRNGADAVQERVELDPPREVRWIAERLEKSGHSAWAVGGAVRDALSGGKPKDWDLTTSARPEEVRRLFARTVPIGIEHGTVGVLGRSGRMYEVTTFRRDVETFGRKARVEFSDRLEEDLERRDFTINAVAWHPLTGELRDPHGGIRDLELGILRTVGDAELRFEEDRLRVLRALRFAGRFDLRIESATNEAITRSAGKLDHLSAERIREELWKVLGGQRSASTTLRLYASSGVLQALYPELERSRRRSEESWSRTLAAVDAASQARLVVRLAVLFHASGAGQGAGEDLKNGAAASAAVARSALRRLRASNAETDTVTHLIAQHVPLPDPSGGDAEVRHWLRRVGRDYVNDILRLQIALCRGGLVEKEGRDLLTLSRRARTLLRAGHPLTIGELAIGGEELRKLGIRPGPRYGEILRALLARVIEEPGLNDPAKLLDLARQMDE